MATLAGRILLYIVTFIGVIVLLRESTRYFMEIIEILWEWYQNLKQEAMPLWMGKVLLNGAFYLC
jgi:hypothetical protein